MATQTDTADTHRITYEECGLCQLEVEDGKWKPTHAQWIHWLNNHPNWRDAVWTEQEKREFHEGKLEPVEHLPYTGKGTFRSIEEDEEDGTFRAYLYVDGDEKLIGIYDTFGEAADALEAMPIG